MRNINDANDGKSFYFETIYFKTRFKIRYLNCSCLREGGGGG